MAKIKLPLKHHNCFMPGIIPTGTRKCPKPATPGTPFWSPPRASISRTYLLSTHGAKDPRLFTKLARPVSPPLFSRTALCHLLILFSSCVRRRATCCVRALLSCLPASALSSIVGRTTYIAPLDQTKECLFFHPSGRNSCLTHRRWTLHYFVRRSFRLQQT